MVGQYHRRRAQRSSNKVLRFFIKSLMTLGFVVILGFVLIVIFFNGSQITKPLSTYLSSKTGMEITIGAADFSPLYPDVIKLYDVRFGNSKIGEFYLEYDLRSALMGERLEIDDIYLNGLSITPEDLALLKEQRLGYNSIYAHLVRFHHTPVTTKFLHAQDATVRLNTVSFSPEEGLTFRSGAIAAGEAQLFDRAVKDLSLQFDHRGTGLNIENFTAAMLGGTVSGHGRYQPHADKQAKGESTGFSSQEGFASEAEADIIFDELTLSKLILHDAPRPSAGVTLSAHEVTLNHIVYTNNPLPTEPKQAKDTTLAAKTENVKAAASQADSTQAASTKVTRELSPEKTPSGSFAYSSLVMQGISGKLYDLKLSHDNLSARFEGNVDALSFPNLETSFEHNQGKAQLEGDKLSFDFTGKLYEGDYAVTGSLDQAQQELTLAQVELSKNKLAINPARLEFLQQESAYTIKLTQAKFDNLEFLSYLQQLPLSIQSVSGSAQDLVWQHDKSEQLTPATILGPVSAQEGSLSLNLHNFLYSNLLLSDIKVETQLRPDALQFNLPKVKFQESNLSAQGTLNLTDDALSTLVLETLDFETADLNSNLIGHMLTGKVNLNAQLSSSFKGWTELGLSTAFTQNLSGHIHLDSQGLLISDFGLDLINGGAHQDYSLSGTELLTALQGSVAGIDNLESDTTFNNGRMNTKGRVSLVTANSSFTVNINLLNHDFSGNAFMISLARDSTTTVSFDGTTQEPRFNIRSLSRGAQRPGLYLPQYEASAQAKEQTDAKNVLNGTVVVAGATSAVAQSAAPTAKQEQLSEEPLPSAATSAEERAPGNDATVETSAPATEPAGAETSTAPETSVDSAAATAPNAAESALAEASTEPEVSADNTEATAPTSSETAFAEASSEPEVSADSAEAANTPTASESALAEVSSEPEVSADSAEAANTPTSSETAFAEASSDPKASADSAEAPPAPTSSETAFAEASSEPKASADSAEAPPAPTSSEIALAEASTEPKASTDSAEATASAEAEVSSAPKASADSAEAANTPTSSETAEAEAAPEPKASADAAAATEPEKVKPQREPDKVAPAEPLFQEEAPSEDLGELWLGDPWDVAPEVEPEATPTVPQGDPWERDPWDMPADSTDNAPATTTPHGDPWDVGPDTPYDAEDELIF